MQNIMIEVYVKLNDNNVIVDINNSIFITNLEGWIKIDEGVGDKYAHSQNYYLQKGLIDSFGVFNYKLFNGVIIELSQSEKDTLFPINIQPTISDLQIQMFELTSQLVEKGSL